MPARALRAVLTCLALAAAAATWLGAGPNAAPAGPGTLTDYVAGRRPVRVLLAKSVGRLRVTGDRALMLAPGAGPLKELGNAAVLECAGADVTVSTGAPPVRLSPAADYRIAAEPPAPLTVRAADARSGRVVLEGSYRGVIVLVPSPSGLAVVNELPVDDYLCGVLGPEIGDDAPPAALRAQAIVARSFALFRVLHRPRSPHYHVLATTTDQVYRGLGCESDAVRKAVGDTRCWVLSTGGDVVDATYHDTSGGTTAEPEVLWGGPIGGVVSVFDGTGSCPSLAEERAARQFLVQPPPTVYGRSSPVFRWRVRYSGAALTATLAETLPAARITGTPRIGRLEDICVGPRSPSGRVTRVTFVGTEGSASVDGDALRWVFGAGSCEPLRSTLIAVDKEGEAPPHPVYELFGGGWGHGAGLSQTGAIEMARAGQGHTEILRHYYPASQLVRVPGSGQAAEAREGEASLAPTGVPDPGTR